MKNQYAQRKPKAGDILIARPDMAENLFSRTVVYLHSYSGEGALGFVLNRPLGQSLERMTGSGSMPDVLQNLPLFFGGPVQSDHFMLAAFTPSPLSHGFDCEMNPDPAHFQEPQQEDGTCLRAFMGYAGWSAGQLDEEIDRKDWEWVPADTAYLLDTPGAELWELLVSGDNRWQRLRSCFPKKAERN